MPKISHVTIKHSERQFYDVYLSFVRNKREKKMKTKIKSDEKQLLPVSQNFIEKLPRYHRSRKQGLSDDYQVDIFYSQKVKKITPEPSEKKYAKRKYDRRFRQVLTADHQYKV